MNTGYIKILNTKRPTKNLSFADNNYKFFSILPNLEFITENSCCDQQNFDSINHDKNIVHYPNKSLKTHVLSKAVITVEQMWQWLNLFRNIFIHCYNWPLFISKLCYITLCNIIILSTGRYNAMYLQNEMQALFNLLFIYI